MVISVLVVYDHIQNSQNHLFFVFLNGPHEQTKQNKTNQGRNGHLLSMRLKTFFAKIFLIFHLESYGGRQTRD